MNNGNFFILLLCLAFIAVLLWFNRLEFAIGFAVVFAGVWLFLEFFIGGKKNESD